MRGRVASITDRGVSTDELHAVLRNLELTKSLMNGASPLLAHVELFGDPNTPSDVPIATATSNKFQRGFAAISSAAGSARGFPRRGIAAS